MKRSRLLDAALASTLIIICTSGNAALVGRHPTTVNGTDYQAYYDDVLQITWLADATLALSQTFGVSSIVGSGSPTQGGMTYNDAQLWITGMNNYDGGDGWLEYNNWRMPIADVDGNGIVVDCRVSNSIDCEDNELGFMLFQNGIGASTPVPFTNVTSTFFRTSTESICGSACIRHYAHYMDSPYTAIGHNVTRDDRARYPVWAVTDGDPFAPIPIPPSLWLFGSGLLGLVGGARKKSQLL